MRRLKNPSAGRDILGVSVIILAVSAILARLVAGGYWPETHDHIRYICLFDHFRDAFRNGIFYPRWLPDSYGGFGYPTFVFYQPGFFFAALLFSAFTTDIFSVMYLTILFFFLAGGIGAYLLAKQISRDWLTGLFCALLFIITPYLYVNLYVRGDLSELCSILLLPWPLFLLHKLKAYIENGRYHGNIVALISVSLFSIVIMHPVTTLFYFPYFAVSAIVISLGLNREIRRLLLVNTAVATAMGIVLSSPYWLTLFQLKKDVHYELALGGYFSISDHAVYFSQLFSNFWGFGGSEPGIENDGMSFQLGLPHFIVAVAGLILVRGRNKFILFSGAVYFLAIIMMLPFFLFFWNGIEMLRFVQFPWRLLSLIAILQIICAAGLARLLPASMPRKALLYIAILAVAAVWNSIQFTFKEYPGHVRELVGNILRNKLFYVNPFASGNELLPRTAKKAFAKSRGNMPLLVTEGGCVVREEPGNSKYHLKYSISNDNGTVVLVNQLYFTGWKAYLDGSSIPEEELVENLLPDGRMTIFIPPGKDHYLELYYDGPPGYLTRNLAIIAAMCLFLAYLASQRKKPEKNFTSST